MCNKKCYINSLSPVLSKERKEKEIFISVYFYYEIKNIFVYNYKYRLKLFHIVIIIDMLKKILYL